jgi:hypothetical protein
MWASWMASAIKVNHGYFNTGLHLACLMAPAGGESKRPHITRRTKRASRAAFSALCKHVSPLWMFLTGANDIIVADVKEEFLSSGFGVQSTQRSRSARFRIMCSVLETDIAQGCQIPGESNTAWFPETTASTREWWNREV